MSNLSDKLPKIAVRLTPDLYARLSAVAGDRRGGMSAIVRDALALHFGIEAKALQPERPEFASLGALPIGAAMKGEHLIEIIATSHGENLELAIAGLNNLAASYRQLADLTSLRQESRARMTRLAEAIDGAAAAGRFRQSQTSGE